MPFLRSTWSGSRLAVLGVVGFVTAAVLAPSRDATAEQAEAPCDAWEIEYGLSAKLQLTDTPMGAGNGVFPIGPGKTVLRFANVDGQPGGQIHMRQYTMHERVKVDSKTAFWTTHVLSESTTVTTPDACGNVATGELEGANLRWQTPLAGSRTDGTITCDGSMCGSFGAPPPGTSELHIPPHPVTFNAFHFAPDLKTFTMPSTLVAKDEHPKQTSHVTLSGREVRRTCVRVTPCQR